MGRRWQVLFDGLEITQFTYFQQAGRVELAPVSAELTYGLERLAMVLQRVDNVYDLEWTNGVKYRDVRLREEIEQSRYVFDRAVNLAPGTFATAHRELFERYYQMTEVLLASGLIWPALEHRLKCPHLFNILDASNSIAATERAAYILRVRRLAVGIAHACIEHKATEPPVELLHS